MKCPKMKRQRMKRCAKHKGNINNGIGIYNNSRFITTVPNCFSYHSGITPRVELANVMDCDIIVSDFQLKSPYYVHFQTNTLKKGMSLLIPKKI